MRINELKTTKMGTEAEEIGVEFILNKGYMPYSPSITASHPIDFFAISGTSSFFLDVKCKPKFKYIPRTGFDKKDFEKYTELDKPSYILFVDSESREVYGAWLSRLAQETPKIHKGNEGKEDVITFPLSACTHYRYLTDEEIEKLKQNSTSNYWK